MPTANPSFQEEHHGRRAAVVIVRTLRDAGHLAYFAGGCVRDELLGRTPSDYDIATDAVPDRVRALFKNTAAVGASFGVILVKAGGEVVEVATFRDDGVYTDARRPDSVTFSTPERDAARRDFTVNALFLDPLDTAQDPRGRVIDFVRGLPDLSARLLRAVGEPDQRLAEDHLRALRAVRLTGKLGFTLDPATAAAIRRHAADLRGVSRERIGDELRQIAVLPGRADSTRLLHDLGLVPSVLGVSPPEPAGLARVMALDPSASATAWLAAWLFDLHQEIEPVRVPLIVRTVRNALCLSNDEDEALADALRGVLALRSWKVGDSETLPARKRGAARAAFPDALAVLAAETPDKAAAVRTDVDRLAADGVGIDPPPLVTGDDLVGGGYRPGPRFRQVLDRVYDAQLRGEVREKRAAMELVARLFV
jgi:tRNA nucleotidyltransferase/poly(A) polymerase